MPLMTPDRTFYPSPAMAMQSPPEKLAYLALVNPLKDGRPDAIGVVDVDPDSSGYGRLVGQTDMPHAGDELHHFGWNACSSCLCPYAPASPHGAAISRRARHQLVSHSRSRHEARSPAAADRESDRRGNSGAAYRLRRAAHRALRTGRDSSQRPGGAGRKWSRRYVHARSGHLRCSRAMGNRSRTAAAACTTSGGTWGSTRW